MEKNRDALERLPSAFFSVGLAAHGDTEEAEGYVEQLEEETAWRPAKVGLFGGALPYTHYGFVKRHMMKRIARDKPGNLGTDTSRDYVYTEWDLRDQVRRGLLDLPRWQSGHHQQLAHRRREVPPIRSEEWRWMAHRQLPGACAALVSHEPLVSQEHLPHGLPLEAGRDLANGLCRRPSGARGWPWPSIGLGRQRTYRPQSRFPSASGSVSCPRQVIGTVDPISARVAVYVYVLCFEITWLRCFLADSTADRPPDQRDGTSGLSLVNGERARTSRSSGSHDQEPALRVGRCCTSPPAQQTPRDSLKLKASVQRGFIDQRHVDQTRRVRAFGASGCARIPVRRARRARA